MADAAWSDDESAGPLVWRSLPLRLALAAVPLWLTASVVIQNFVDWPIKLVVAIVLGVTLVDPAYGLLLIALAAPLGDLINQTIGIGAFRVSEAIVITFLAGCLPRAWRDRRGPCVAAPALAWLFATAIVASIAGLAWQLGRRPGELTPTINQIAHAYFFNPDRIGLVEGARLLEGISLVAATVMLFRRHPIIAERLPLALSVSAAVAALSSVMLWQGFGTAIAVARLKVIGGYRISAHVGDVNAVGTYFAMNLCLALGMAARGRGGRRVLWVVLASASGAGLWLSESRSAMGAAGAVVIVAAMWVATSRFTTKIRAVVLTVVVLTLIGGALFRARRLEIDPDYRGATFREQFIQTSLRMIASRPLFGVGVGQYYRMSPLYLSPQLAWTYGSENGHNYFLQIGGELGLVGLGLFVTWLGAGISRTGRALARAPADTRLLGAGGGVVAFLITALTGHPFLVGEVAYPFWIQVGLMTALAGSVLLNQTTEADRPDAPRVPRRARTVLAGTAAVVILLWSPIATARMPDQAPDSQAIDGFYRWETLDDGTRFRWTGRYASLFVPPDVTRVEIPVRVPVDGRSIKAMGVEVMSGGADRGRTMVGADWAIISVRPADALAPTPFKRIDLKVDRVWEPAFYIAGSADRRPVGVQVGEPRLFRN